MQRIRRAAHACAIALIAGALTLAATAACAKSADSLAVQLAQLLNARLPQMVSKDTRLDHMQGDPGNTLTYYMTYLPLPSTALDHTKLAVIQRGLLLNMGCDARSTLTLLRLGLTLKVIVRGNDGLEMVRQTVTAADCGVRPKQATIGEG